MSQITAYFIAEGITQETICGAIKQEHTGTLSHVKFCGVENTITYGRVYSANGDAQEVMVLIGRLAAMGYANLCRVNVD